MSEGAETEAAAEPEAPVDPAAAALAIALDGAAHDPGLRDDIAAFLARQGALIEDQRHHLRVQLGQLGLKILGDRMRLAVQAISLAALLGLIALAAVMVRDAIQDRGLVIDRFSSSPSLAARGLTGEALADQLFGRIDTIRRAANTASFTVSEDVRAGGGDSIKLEIPETGLSLDQVDRFLHQTLGHARRLQAAASDVGEARTRIEVRVSQADPIVVEGLSADLDTLLQQAAEQAFAAFDPVNYVIYLRVQGRADEAMIAAERNFKAASAPVEINNALSLWGNSDNDRRRALRRGILAAQLYPKGFGGWFEAARASEDLGHDQDALTFYRGVLRTRASDQWRNIRASQPGIAYTTRLSIDRLMADGPAFDRDFSPAPPGEPLGLPGRYVLHAIVLAQRHDCQGARQGLAQAADMRPDIALGAGQERSSFAARWAIAVCAGDWPAALAAAQQGQAHDAGAKAGFSTHASADLVTLDPPQTALALAHLGRLAEAEPILAATPPDCYLCLRARGAVAALANRPAESDRWFAEAARQAPSLAFAHQEWGQARLARADWSGAEAAFAEAARRAPRWADPVKGLGDVAAGQGRWPEARAHYARALKLAPAWAELRQASAAAAARRSP